VGFRFDDGTNYNQRACRPCENVGHDIMRTVKRTLIQLDEDTYNKLRNRAFKQKRSMSSVAREVIATGLENGKRKKFINRYGLPGFPRGTMRRWPRSFTLRSVRNDFLDTSAIYAWTDVRDLNHQAAVERLRAILESREELLTHNYVLLESISILQARLGLSAAVKLAQDSTAFHIEWVDQELHDSGIRDLEKSAKS